MDRAQEPSESSGDAMTTEPSLEQIERDNRKSLGALNRRIQAMLTRAGALDLEDVLTGETEEGRLEYERNLLWNKRTTEREEAEVRAADRRRRGEDT